MNADGTSERQWSVLVPAIICAAIALGLHLYTNIFAGYGFFRDELYYMVCSERLAFGYVDQPPFSLAVLTGIRATLGSSLFAIRLLPALLHAVTVLLAGMIARDMGSRTGGTTLACLATALCPVFLGISTIYSMNGIDLVLWALLAWIFLRLLKEPTPRRWIIFGAIAGIGLMNKIGIAWLIAGLFIGLALSVHRRQFKTPWPWFAGGIAALIFSPFVIWNAMNGWPHLEFIHNAVQMKYQSQTPVTFLSGLIVNQNPVSFILWFGGLIWLLVATRARPMRPIAWAYLTALAILIINWHSKPGYLAPGATMLYAAGGAWISGITRTWMRRVVVYGCCSIILVTGIAILPMALPILPVDSFIAYTQAIGQAPSTAEGHELKQLPQFYADMFGWQGKAEAVAAVYNALPDSAKEDCAIFADNYGRCAAMDIFGRPLGLPPVIGNHNNYWLWGPRDHQGETVIILGDRNDAHNDFEHVEIARIIPCRNCLPYEDSLAVFVCHGINRSIPEIWPAIRWYL